MADLTPAELAKQWTQGAFKPAYLLFGEDAPAKQLALETIRKIVGADAFNLDEFTGEDEAQAGEIISACQTPPMFSDRRLVTVRNAKFAAAGRKVIAEYLRNPLKSTLLIMISPEPRPDAKDAMASAVRAMGGLALFKPLREGDAIKRLNSEAKKFGFTLAPDAAQALVDEAGTEWGILRAELQKIKLFIGERDNASQADVASCLGYSQTSNPFDLPRLLQKRDSKASLTLLRRQLRETGETFRLLYQITRTVNNQLRAKRLVKSGESSEKIFRKLRLNSYYDRDYLSIVERIPENNLIRSLTQCLHTEKSLKSKSWLNPGIELENLVLKVCKK
ncbi:MAG: DNA polymerase III subunit delta [Elusimicrobia bacterium]|nr:MAG: DNA polymerase III subunit delta [Elusimicrobiota bacterium]